MQEIELKFFVPDVKVDALMRQVDIKSAKKQSLSAHYFDTSDQSLAKDGVAIRIRKESEAGREQDAEWVQTLKSGGDGMLARLEHNHTLDASATDKAHKDGTLMPDMSIYTDSEVADALADFDLQKQDLVRQYSTEVTRITRLIKKDGNVIEVAYDEGKVVHGTDSNKQMPIHELEFELLRGNIDFLLETAKTWCKRYKLCLSTVTKAERGGLLLADKTHADATKSDLSALTVNKKMSQPEFMRAVVLNCLQQILPNATAIASGSDDGNHVHQLRVGMRRLRTALKLFGDFSSNINPEWIPILKQTFSLLGDYRDREILELKTQPMLEAEGSPFVDWSPERNALKVSPLDAVRANDFQLTLLELIAYATSNPKGDKGANSDSAKQAVSKILDKLFKKIRKASDKFAELDVEAQHDVRKRLKSLRYISEFASPMFKKKKTKAFLKYLEPAQDVLGEYNDSMVGHEFYQAKTTSDPNAWFAVGYFGANEAHHAKECATSLKTVKDAPIFW